MTAALTILRCRWVFNSRRYILDLRQGQRAISQPIGPGTERVSARSVSLFPEDEVGRPRVGPRISPWVPYGLLLCRG
ncbi:hypothetical protein NDU88_000935 [Pleurodeles waltl]|uniref:Uncharacterized protein n=1 Tax=Pleurodeles waltl TaxID=8319 RepID=A0AAV7V6G6_PLEWA|nr:hypothetical protein NDU88_000935 [Pleurodeles waltl]